MALYSLALAELMRGGQAADAPGIRAGIWVLEVEEVEVEVVSVTAAAVLMAERGWSGAGDVAAFRASGVSFTLSAAPSRFGGEGLGV